MNCFPLWRFCGRMFSATAMTGTGKVAGVCAEKHRLTEAIIYAARQIQSLHDSEIADLVAGRTSPDRGRFDIAIKLARKRSDEARRAYTKHVRIHGC